MVTKNPTRWAVLLTILAVLSAAAPARAGEPTDEAVVRTDAGPVRGTVTDDVRIFHAIPYATPPVQRLRWKPPRPVRPWSAVRDATTPASPCPQQPNLEVPQGITDEDCLYLNVTTPRRPAKEPRAVLVWVHGGGFVTGAGSSYGGQPLAARGDVVVVTINYRLGVLGFFGHTGLDDSGSFGLQDQQAALRWVRRNAAAFGGDPDNITLAGESAGAISVCGHLTSPSSAGLFDKAVMQSGSCAYNWPPNSRYPGQEAGSPYLPRDTVQRTGDEIAGQLGCPGGDGALDCLRRLPAAALLEQTQSFALPAFGTTALPEHPAEALRAGRFHRMPVLSGTTHDEARLGIEAFNGGAIGGADFHRLVIDMVGAANAPKVEAEYPLARYDSPAIAWGAVTTDRIWSCTQATTDRLLAREVPTYVYDFADEHSPLAQLMPSPIPLGAAHTMELPYLFALGDANLPFTPDQQRLSEQMIDYWTSFARSGDPDGPGRPRWSPMRGRVTGLSLAPSGQGDIQRVDIAAEHHCELWDRLR